MYLIRAYFVLFAISARICLSSPDNVDDYIELDDDLDWDAVATTTTLDELDVNATNVPENEFTTLPIETTIKSSQSIDDALAAESKVHELSAVLKTTVHRIRQQYKKMDIVFLIDSSSSVGKSNFRSELKFVTKFLSDFNVSFNYTRVSIVTFSSQEKIVCYHFLKQKKNYKIK